jgi:hypothetical protein
MLVIAGRGLTRIASTRLTKSRSKKLSTLCLRGIATQRLPSSTYRMFHLRPSPGRWQGAFGTREDGLFRNSWLQNLSYFIRRIGLYISTIARLTIRSPLRSLGELGDATGIDSRALLTFHPGERSAREILRWVSGRVTTKQEDIAYSLFGIFGVNLPLIYGEKKQNALGRLLQEVVTSGDITTLDWVGKPSKFNTCLPADITSYEVPSRILHSLSKDEMEASVSSLRTAVGVELASIFHNKLYCLRAPRFAARRLQLPCIVFSVTAVERRSDQPLFTFTIKADGLRDLTIATEDRLDELWRARCAQQSFLLVHPWDRSLLHLSPGENAEEFYSQTLQLIARLGQPFSAFLLAEGWSGEYKRIASDQSIIAQVRYMTSVNDMMDVRRLEIL